MWGWEAGERQSWLRGLTSSPHKAPRCQTQPHTPPSPPSPVPPKPHVTGRRLHHRAAP